MGDLFDALPALESLAGRVGIAVDSRPDRGGVDEGLVPRDVVDLDDPLGFLTADGAAESVVDAAYRFFRHEPGCGVILTEAGSREHLEQNLRSLARARFRPPCSSG